MAAKESVMAARSVLFGNKNAPTRVNRQTKADVATCPD
jgi:hypothetical protein